MNRGDLLSQWAFPGLSKVRRLPDELSHDLRLEGLVQLAVDHADFGIYPYEVVRALLLAGYVDACTQVAKSHDDAFVSRAGLRRWMSDVVIDALARPLADEHPGVLHRRGEQCHCLAGRDWPPPADFAVHNFLAVNGTRKEKNLTTAKKKELRVFRAEVFRRDRFMCRICLVMPDSLDDHRSPRSLHLGHIDPNAAAGPDNLATMCKACNEKLANYTPDQKFVELYAAPLHPARSFEEATEDAEATRAAVRGMPRPVMPGHGQPLSPSPSPRPADQVDPWNRAQIPTGPPADPHPPDPIHTGSKPDPDPIPTRSGSGPEPGPKTGPDPVNPSDRDPMPAQAPDYLGREGEGQPARASPGVITPGLQRFLALLPQGTPMPVWEIVKITGFNAQHVEEGLRRLAGHGFVERHPAGEGCPVTWQRT